MFFNLAFEDVFVGLVAIAAVAVCLMVMCFIAEQLDKRGF